MKQNLTISYDDYIIKFKSLIKSLGLNNSIQREYVLKILFNCKNHLSAEQIVARVKEEYNISIGIATVYRIINLLEDMKVIKSISIDNNDAKVYELNLVSHHDHMVCIKCGKIIEFFDAEVERMQELVALENGFVLQSHDMVLYGTCKECQENE